MRRNVALPEPWSKDKGQHQGALGELGAESDENDKRQAQQTTQFRCPACERSATAVPGCGSRPQCVATWPGRVSGNDSDMSLHHARSPADGLGRVGCLAFKKGFSQRAGKLGQSAWLRRLACGGGSRASSLLIRDKSVVPHHWSPSHYHCYAEHQAAVASLRPGPVRPGTAPRSSFPPRPER